MNEHTWLEGRISIAAAIRGQSRAILAIYVSRVKRDWGLRKLLQTAVSANIKVEHVAAAFIEARAAGKTHGGVIAQVGPRRFLDLADLVANSARPWVVMLDGIEDPFNFGQAVRALYAAGVDGLVVRPRNWLTAAGVVARASAGASELAPTAVADTALAAADFYRERGLTVACTAIQNSVPIYETNLAAPLFLLIGGEKRGVTRSFLDQADMRLQIPYGRPFNRSLGAAAAAAILGFEIMRQRRL